MSRNTEQEASSCLHKNNTPVLISSRLLREYGCGQIDVAYVQNNILYLVEVKSSTIGVKSYFTKQYIRMLKSAKLLTSLLHMPIKLKIIAKM